MILVLSPNLEERGGIQEYSRKVLASLKEGGIEFEALELKSSDFMDKIIFSISFFWKVLFTRPRTIFLTHIGFAPLALFVKKTLKIKYFVAAHGIEVWKLGDKAKYVSCADLVLAVSTFTKNKILDQVPNISSKIKILHNSVDGEEFYIKSENLRSKYGFKDADKIIFTLARLSKSEAYKGYDKIIKCMPEILKNVPEAKYLIGGNGDDVQRINNMIHEMGLSDKVFLLGNISSKEKLVDYYNMADVFAMPSKGEGFGIVFIEAMACGTPVVAGDKDGSVDALAGGDLGFLVDPDDSKEIIHSIQRVFSGNVPRGLKGEELRREALERFSAIKFNLKFKEIIKSE